MQAGSRRSNGTRLLGENRLISLTVGQLIWAIDVGREWHVPQSVQMLTYGARIARSKAQSSQTEFSGGDHFGLKFTSTKQNSLAESDLFCRPSQDFPGGRIQLARQKNLHIR